MQVTLQQPCVDLSRALPSPMYAWKDASKLAPRAVGTTGLSPSLDRLRGMHAGAGQGGDSSMLHEAPPEVAAFGAVYGLSCGSVWVHTGKDWDRLADLAERWVDRALEEHERTSPGWFGKTREA